MQDNQKPCRNIKLWDVISDDQDTEGRVFAVGVATGEMSLLVAHSGCEKLVRGLCTPLFPAPFLPVNQGQQAM